MKNVLVSLTNNTLVFSYHNKAMKEQNLLNTNVISREELVFSFEYLDKNKKLVALFLSDLVNENQVSKIVIEDYTLGKHVIDIINMVKDIKEMMFLEESALPYTLCEKIIDNKSLVALNVYSIPPYMLEMLDRSNMAVETRSEVLFTSNFMAVNNLTQYSKIYYKTTIRIENQFDDKDFEDFETFCKVNRYLKTIHLYFVDLELLEKIVLFLHSLRIKNVKVLIHKNITDKQIVTRLRMLNKEYKNKYNISLKIIYSESYLKENIFAQVVLNIFKTCTVVIVVIVMAVFGTVLFNNYLSLRKVEGISGDLDALIKDVKEEPIPEPTPDPTEEDPEEGLKPQEQTITRKFSTLLNVNDETVGWLKVNNTNIDYPIVKGNDNSFYLTRDYYKKKDYNGWVFMDYRNSVENLGKNTILYGHNRYYSGVIFGTLNNVVKKSWYTKKENQIISFDTLYEEAKWQIFSIYRIDKTSDYIATFFKSDEEYLKFLKMVQKRSIHNFKQELAITDKILTLSTCLDNDQRLVVHAKLIVK